MLVGLACPSEKLRILISLTVTMAGSGPDEGH